MILALDALLDPVTRGDPESALRWTAKLAAELAAQGHRVWPRTVAKLLKASGTARGRTRKPLEVHNTWTGMPSFAYLNSKARQFQDAGDPVMLSVV